MNFSEKLDFAIKKHDFWPFFVTNFDQFLVIFHPFLGSFLGFLGGYPSPSISAPLVVKKCPKLYIYNIGGQPPLWYYTPHQQALINWNAQNAQNCGYHEIEWFRFHRGENESIKNWYPVNLPDIWIKHSQPINTANILTEGRTRVLNQISSPVYSPRQPYSNY